MPSSELQVLRLISEEQCAIGAVQPRYFRGSYEQLAKKLGSPNAVTDPDKSTTRWTIEYSGAYFEIFDSEEIDLSVETYDASQNRIRSSETIEWTLLASNKEKEEAFLQYLGVQEGR